MAMVLLSQYVENRQYTVTTDSLRDRGKTMVPKRKADARKKEYRPVVGSSSLPAAYTQAEQIYAAGVDYSAPSRPPLQNPEPPMQQPLRSRKSKRRREWMVYLQAMLIFMSIMAVTVLFMFIRKQHVNKEFRELALQIEQAMDGSLESADSTPPTQQDAASSDTAEPGILPKYAALAEANPDFFGWIRMEDTLLDCPVMLSIDDNDKYLYTNFRGEHSYAGIPFADNNCTRDSDNIVIYGHNLRDGSVFHSLLNYAEESYWQEHPTIMFSDLYHDYEYEVMAVFYDRVYERDESAFRYYRFMNAQSEEEFDYAVSMFTQKALYDTDVQAHYGDHLITLSTCSYHVENGRFVVVARRID